LKKTKGEKEDDNLKTTKNGSFTTLEISTPGRSNKKSRNLQHTWSVGSRDMNLNADYTTLTGSQTQQAVSI
jgi:hypothetical protein